MIQKAKERGHWRGKAQAGVVNNMPFERETGVQNGEDAKGLQLTEIFNRTGASETETLILRNRTFQQGPTLTQGCLVSCH